MKIKYRMVALLCVSLISGGAYAATFTQPSIGVTGTGAFNYHNASYSFSPTGSPPILDIWGWDSGNLTPQSPSNVGNEIDTAFGITTVFKESQDSWNGSEINLTESFNYLSVHVGGGDILFRFYDTYTGPFSISKTGGTGGGISNFRTYLGPVTPSVPIPAAVWLFGSGLVGLIGFSRRKSTSALQA